MTRKNEKYYYLFFGSKKQHTGDASKENASIPLLIRMMGVHDLNISVGRNINGVRGRKSYLSCRQRRKVMQLIAASFKYYFPA